MRSDATRTGPRASDATRTMASSSGARTATFPVERHVGRRVGHPVERRVGRCVRRAGLACAALALLALAGVTPRAAIGRAPDERAAAELFAELVRQAPARPLYAVAGLEITRGGVTRALGLRIHLRGPGHVLIQVKEPRSANGPRVDGTVCLQYRDRLHLWFPRAALALQVPVQLGAARLFGSDFALDHLQVLAGDDQRWRAVDVTAGTLGDESCQQLRLVPRGLDGPLGAAAAPDPGHAGTNASAVPSAVVPAGAPTAAETGADTCFAALELWLARGPKGELVPRQLDGFDAHGVLTSRVRLQSSGRLGLPDRWTAWTLPQRPHAADPGAAVDLSTLRVTLVELQPHVAPAQFLPEALPSWR